MLRRSKAIPRRASSFATLSKRCGWRGTSSRQCAGSSAVQRSVRVEQLLLLAGVSTAGDPHRPRAEVLAAQLASLARCTDSPSCMSNFTLPTTCVRARVGAEGDEALRILRRSAPRPRWSPRPRR